MLVLDEADEMLNRGFKEQAGRFTRTAGAVVLTGVIARHGQNCYLVWHSLPPLKLSF